jgi:predicted RNA-binding Zn ribbon-like protein
MTDTSQSVTFRSATPTTEAAPAPSKTEASPTTQGTSQGFSDDASPTVYAELEKKPYAVKHLDLGLYYDDKDFSEVQDQAKELDDYVHKQVKARGLKDSASSYKEVVDAIYKQIGKSPNEDPVKALKRLTTAASAISRLESAKLQPVLSAQNLSPTEFEGIQE